MKTNVLRWLTGFLFALPVSLLANSATHPAMIGQGPGSVAMQLHYPAKEKAAKSQGVVKFYCEVSPDGKASHITSYYGRKDGRFGTAVEFALRHGLVTPAAVDGRPTSVMLGGTVLFLISEGHPTIALTLATAETDKIAGMSNYVQPQMIDTDALFRRKIYSHRDKYHQQYGAHPAVVVQAHVDANGKLTSKKIVSEAPPNGGRGRLMMDVLDEEHFIPAQNNGQPVAGDFEIAVDFEHMRDPDSGPDVGTLLKKNGY
ncbi:MAG TPA: energy transducer TonB [Chthoniobacterales bacterium]|jgi:hypothetical protein